MYFLEHLLNHARIQQCANLLHRPRPTKQTSAQPTKKSAPRPSRTTPADNTAKKIPPPRDDCPTVGPKRAAHPPTDTLQTRERATPQRYATSYPKRALLTGMIDWDIQYAASGSPPKKTGNGGRRGLRKAAAFRPKLLEKSDRARI